MSLKGILADENQLEWLRLAAKGELFQSVPEEIIEYRDTILAQAGVESFEWVESIEPFGDIHDNLYSIQYKLTNGIIISAPMHYFTPKHKVFELVLILPEEEVFPSLSSIEDLCTMGDDPNDVVRIIDYYCRTICVNNPNPHDASKFKIIPHEE